MNYLDRTRKLDPRFIALGQAFNEGLLDDPWEIFEELADAVETRDRLRRHAVPREEIDVWQKLYWKKYQHLSKRKAAKLIKDELLSCWSDGTIRRHL